MYGHRVMKLLVASALTFGNACWAKPVDDGALDLTFGDGGRQVFDLGWNEVAAQVVLSKDGSFYLAGIAAPGFSVAKVTATGKRSLDFPGHVYPDPGAAEQWFGAQSAAEAPDGTLLVAGYYAPTHYAPDWHWVICRFDTAGNAVSGFGDGTVAPGCATEFAGVGPLRGELRDIAVLPDGRIVVSGHVVDSHGRRQAAVTRLNVDGTIDASFSTTTEALPNIVLPGGNEHESLLEGLALGGDGSIVVVGGLVLSDTDTNILVSRLSEDGALDPAFDGDGVAIYPIDIGENAKVDFASEVIELSNGSILFVGSAQYEDTRRAAGVVMAIHPDGTPLETFGQNGRVLVHEADADVRFLTIADAGSSRVVVGGKRGGLFNGMPALFRLDAHGQVDKSFGGEAGVIFSFSPDDTSSGINDLIVHKGQVVVAGYASHWGSQDFALARFGTLRLFSDGMEIGAP